MSSDESKLAGPDLAAGFPFSSIPEGELFAAHAHGKPIVVVRRGNAVNAIGAQCSHYGGPLGEGLLVGDTVRCPWHHACFSLRTGEALQAPALKPVAVWSLEVRGGTVFAHQEQEPGDGASPMPGRPAVPADIKAIVIVGGGGAGNAAAEMLRREGFGGSVTMLSADDSIPYDRPNLSKDYLAGNAPEEWIPLRSAEFYQEHSIDVVLGTLADTIDTSAKRVRLVDGREFPFDRLLLATGAEPVRLKIPGSELPHVHYLRTLADSRRIINAASSAKSAVVMGASFIGLEVAASLRTRGVAVHVIAPERVPLERVMGVTVGGLVRDIHEAHGVTFHLGQTASAIDAKGVTTVQGNRITADLVVIGVGVKPSLGIAERAGLALDRGVLVNEFLETSVRGVFAAGDIARWPDRHSGSAIRVEHWVVAERQGQTAAKNMLGRSEPFDAVPFFWSAHYDTTISYVGHAEHWETESVDGDLRAGNAAVTLSRAGKSAAVITVGRDRESLRAETRAERTRHS